MNKIESVKLMIMLAEEEAERFPDKSSGLRVAKSKGLRILQTEYRRLLEQIMTPDEANTEAKRFLDIDELINRFPENYDTGTISAGMSIEEIDRIEYDGINLDNIWEEVRDNDWRASLRIKKPARKPKPVVKLKLRF